MSETSATPCFFKQIDEKHINQEVSQMLWNPRMDLIALAFSNGDIHLYRMNWQRVWSYSSPHQNLTVTSMAWRPDGKSMIRQFFRFFCLSYRK
jgi:anaphase-promoting complex subunit 4